MAVAPLLPIPRPLTKSHAPTSPSLSQQPLTTSCLLAYLGGQVHARFLEAKAKQECELQQDAERKVEKKMRTDADMKRSLAEQMRINEERKKSELQDKRDLAAR